MPASFGPGVAPSVLRERAGVVAALRTYFARQGVLEVATPVVIAHASTEPSLANLEVSAPGGAQPRGYLRTSPEAAMKRLLAAGSGDIYQLGPVCRADERGRHHLLEFTLLEWYRLGFDLVRLMDDVEGALRAAGFTRAIARLSYGELFAREFGVSPHGLATSALAGLAAARGLAPAAAAADVDDRALLFDCLYVAALEPALGAAGAVFLHGFPRELRAYARLGDGEPKVAARFELIVDGLELANGYHEITDAAEQAACFAAENALRARRRLPQVAVDRAWLAALAHGLPACAGVALGLERLLIVLGLGERVDQVAPFAAELDA